jgi:four helix bundle protein
MNRPHKRLDVWKVSMELAGSVYRLTASFPPEERFGLVSQMRRAVISIPSNLAEGAARRSSKEYRHYVTIARASLSELDTQLDISRQLGLISDAVRSQLDSTLIRIDMMLHWLYESKKAGESGRTESPRTGKAGKR